MLVRFLSNVIYSLLPYLAANITPATGIEAEGKLFLLHGEL